MHGFEAALAGVRVTPIDIAGTAFDPPSTAIGTDRVALVDDGSVVARTRPGSLRDDELLRRAQVTVAQPK